MSRKHLEYWKNVNYMMLMFLAGDIISIKTATKFSLNHEKIQEGERWSPNVETLVLKKKKSEQYLLVFVVSSVWKRSGLRRLKNYILIRNLAANSFDCYNMDNFVSRVFERFIKCTSNITKTQVIDYIHGVQWPIPKPLRIDIYFQFKKCFTWCNEVF